MTEESKSGRKLSEEEYEMMEQQEAEEAYQQQLIWERMDAEEAYERYMEELRAERNAEIMADLYKEMSKHELP